MGCAYASEVDRVRRAPRHLVGERANVQEGAQIVSRPPLELALTSGHSLEEYALARMIESEWGSGPAAALIALGEVARNTARARGVSIFELLTNEPKKPEEHGLFGRQSGRWAATSVSPTERSMAAAEAVLRGTQMAAGAGKFYAPKASDGGLQAGKTIPDALRVYDSWTSEGWRFAARAPMYADWCVSPYELFLLAKSNSTWTVSIAQGRLVIEEARRARGIA